MLGGFEVTQNLVVAWEEAGFTFIQKLGKLGFEALVWGQIEHRGQHQEEKSNV